MGNMGLPAPLGRKGLPGRAGLSGEQGMQNSTCE